MRQVYLGMILISLFSLHGYATAEKDSLPNAEFKSHGIYSLTGNTVYYDAVHAATGYGRMFETGVLLHETTEIPAIKCMSFGYEYEIKNLPNIHDDNITIVVKHPLMQNYLGMKTNITIGELPLPVNDGRYRNSIIYVMRHPYEVLPGDWELQIVYHGDVVLAKSFHVYASNKDQKYNNALECDA